MQVKCFMRGMTRIILYCVVTLYFTLTSFAKDLTYYTQNPSTLQNMMTQCSLQKQVTTSCDELRHMALRLNDFAQLLRMNPLEYGQQILALQANIAEQVGSQRSNTLAKNKQELAERLTMIKWLESPRS